MKNWKFTVMSEDCKLLRCDNCSECGSMLVYWLVEGRRKGMMGILEFDFSNGAGSLLKI